MTYLPYQPKAVKHPFLKPLKWKRVMEEDSPTFLAKCNGNVYYQLIKNDIKKYIRPFTVSYCYKDWDPWSKCDAFIPFESMAYETKKEALMAIEECRHNLAKEMLPKDVIAKIKSI